LFSTLLKLRIPLFKMNTSHPSSKKRGRSNKTSPQKKLKSDHHTDETELMTNEEWERQSGRCSRCHSKLPSNEFEPISNREWWKQYIG